MESGKVSFNCLGIKKDPSYTRIFFDSHPIWTSSAHRFLLTAHSIKNIPNKRNVFSGDPGGARTHDHWLKRPTLYLLS